MRKEATQTRGGMIWREISGGKYLRRTSPKGAHKSFDVWAVQASTGDRILGSPRFSQMVVSTHGEMAFMDTMHPMDFVKIKRVLGNYPTRDPLKRTKDLLQADLVEELVHSHMPQYLRGDETRLQRAD